MCAAAALDLNKLLQQAKSWLKAAEFNRCSLLACLCKNALDRHALTALFKAEDMKTRCFALCALPPFLLASFHYFPLLPLLYSASIALPLPLSPARSTALYSPVTKGGLVNELNEYAQMHKLIYHTEAKQNKIDRRPFISKHFTLWARLELICRAIS